MTNFRDEFALKYEVGTSFGDSGGGGLIEKDGKLYTIGVVSHGYGSVDENGASYRSWGFIGAYTRADGASLPWLKANLANLGKNGAQEATDCENWASNSVNTNLPNQSPDDYVDPMDIFLDQDNPFQFGDPNHPYFNCPCDCSEDEEADKECWAACDKCLGNAITIDPNDIGLLNQEPDDVLDIFTPNDNPGQFGDPNQPYFNCPCDCGEDEEEDSECWATCDRCLGNAIVI